MPTYDPEKIPPENRRAAKGSSTGRMSGHHTTVSLNAQEVAVARHRINRARALRLGAILLSLVGEDDPLLAKAKALEASSGEESL